jgi:small subunit ribosomal protein S17
MVAITKEPKKLFKGTVVSDKMEKTVVVIVEQTYVHPKLEKVLKRTKKYKVHDETRQAKEGDVVEFYHVRPLSKTKYMNLHHMVTPATGS